MTNNCKVELIGNLGQEPKIMKAEKGNEFVILSVATTDSYKDKKGNWQNKETLWHDVIIFSPNAIKFAKELKKGDRVHVKGILSYKQVESKEGYRISQASIVASFIVKSPIPETNEEISE